MTKSVKMTQNARCHQRCFAATYSACEGMHPGCPILEAASLLVTGCIRIAKSKYYLIQAPPATANDPKIGNTYAKHGPQWAHFFAFFVFFAFVAFFGHGRGCRCKNRNQRDKLHLKKKKKTFRDSYFART